MVLVLAATPRKIENHPHPNPPLEGEGVEMLRLLQATLAARVAADVSK